MPGVRENVDARRAEALAAIREATAHGLMHVTIERRLSNKRVRLAHPDGAAARDVVEFINCSYLGLDTHPAVVGAAADIVREWGVHFCCARSRFSIEPNRALERDLSTLFRGYAITFPSVTAAHLSALPLIASGALLPSSLRRHRGVRLIFDRFAHASMQSIKPLLAVDATIVTIAHNDVRAIATAVDEAHAADEDAVYVADSVYSMGGVCPLDEIKQLVEQRGAFLYLDDAHGTSIFGERGEGYVMAREAGALPPSTIMTFSLAKGFGTNGGGIVLPSEEQRQTVRSLGQTYAFSAPLDFSVIGAAQASLALHFDGTVRRLQDELRNKVATFDAALARTSVGAAAASTREGFSPIRMVPLQSKEQAIAVGRGLIARGYFVSVAMYPVVARDQPQLRVCLSVEHSDEQVHGLVAALDDVIRSVPP